MIPARVATDCGVLGARSQASRTSRSLSASAIGSAFVAMRSTIQWSSSNVKLFTIHYTRSAISIDLYFDFVSPYSYLLLTQAAEFGQQHGITWRPQPVVYGALLNHTGLVGPVEVDVKRRYTFTDIRRSAALLGVPLVGPPAHPFRSLEALRTVSLFLGDPRCLDLSTALAQACWGSWPRPDRQQRASGGRCRNRPPGQRPGASAADHRDQGPPARNNLAGYRARGVRSTDLPSGRRAVLGP